ncbi:hypothetical protein [Acinetobacter baumannii]|uniref:hypothetical protein n=1 Tax=Acinetobacter baumannii TaxID=470 RepID=UPI002AF6AD16|nr:hypothetical protein [Acinetobacter baumannii]
MLYFLKHQNLYNMKTIAFVCLTLISITCLAEPSQKYLKEYDRLSEALESAMANAYSFDPATGQVKQATQGLEAKNNLCRAAQAKLNLTTFLKDNLEESKELYKSIDGAETLAWGKAISLVIGSVAGAITAITTFFKYIF